MCVLGLGLGPALGCAAVRSLSREHLAGFSHRALVSLWWALTKRPRGLGGGRGSILRGMHAVLPHLYGAWLRGFQRETKRRMPALGPVELSMVLYGFGQLEVAPTASWLSRWAGQEGGGRWGESEKGGGTQAKCCYLV